MHCDLLRKAFYSVRHRFQVVAFASSTVEVLTALQQNRPQVAVISSDQTIAMARRCADLARNRCGCGHRIKTLLTSKHLVQCYSHSNAAQKGDTMKRLTVRMQTSRGLFARLAPIIVLTALLIVAPFHAALAQVAPSLGTAQTFAVLGSSTVTNTGPTIITGDLGVDPGTAVTGFPPGLVVGGTIHAADSVALNAQNATTTAYNSLASQARTSTLTGEDLGGLTLVPGVYFFATSAQLTGKLTLNGGGDPSAVWVFQIGSTLTTASNSSVVVENGGQNCNVFWQVGSSATIGTGTTFIGNILANASITLTTNATLSGRALAQTAAVTLDSNTVSVSVCAAVTPTLGKAFSPATIAAGGVSALAITLSNAGPTATTASGFTDTLPSGVTVSSIVSNGCGGTLTTTSSTVTLAEGSIPANSFCTVTVDVTAPIGGSYINSMAAGALVTSNGSNAAPAVATLTVIAHGVIAPTLGKAFSPPTISTGGSSILTITLSNAGTTTSLTEPLIDTLPSGMSVSSISGPVCGVTPSFANSLGVSTVTLPAGASIPANGSCTVTATVTTSGAGNYINSLAAGALVTGNGINAAPAIATLTVIAPGSVAPTLSKAFSLTTINAGGTSTLTITLSNPSTSSADTLSEPLIDTLPGGMVVSGIASASASCGVKKPTVKTISGVTTVTLPAGASIPANGSCTVTVPVTVSGGGSYINSLAAGALQTNNGPNTFPVIATLTVSTPSAVTLNKAFSPPTINAGGISTITITLTNTGATAAMLTAPLTDKLPPGAVVVAESVNSTCIEPLNGFNIQRPTRQPRLQTVAFRMPAKILPWFTVSASKVTLATGTSIAAGSSCTVTFEVTAPGAGSYFNALAAGALQTNNGNNAAPVVATLTVLPVPPTLSKSFSPANIKSGKLSTLTIKLGNPTNNTIAKLTASLTDTLPKGVVIASTPNASTTCNGPLSATAGSSVVKLEGGSIPSKGSCKVTVEVTASIAGGHINTLPVGALHTSNGSNAAEAVATLTVK
jgi:uncharacterized repeat protein (TIGR01451 family)